MAIIFFTVAIATDGSTTHPSNTRRAWTTPPRAVSRTALMSTQDLSTGKSCETNSSGSPAAAVETEATAALDGLPAVVKFHTPRIFSVFAVELKRILSRGARSVFWECRASAQDQRCKRVDQTPTAVSNTATPIYEVSRLALLRGRSVALRHDASRPASKLTTTESISSKTPRWNL